MILSLTQKKYWNTEKISIKYYISFPDNRNGNVNCFLFTAKLWK